MISDLKLKAIAKAEYRSTLRSKGICVRCGQRPVTTGMKSCDICRPRHEKVRKAYRASLKRRTFNAYGGCICSCPPCGETLISFLTIDHISNIGKKRTTSGNKFYEKLKTQGYPPGYRVLCFNCNTGRHINGGICPHITSNTLLAQK